MSDSISVFQVGKQYFEYDGSSDYELIVNGKTIDKNKGVSDPTCVYINHRDLYEEISLYEIGKLIEKYDLFITFLDKEPIYLSDNFFDLSVDYISINLDSHSSIKEVFSAKITFTLGVNLTHWTNSWSALAHINFFHDYLKEAELNFSIHEGFFNLESEDMPMNMEFIELHLNEANLTLKEIISDCIHAFRTAHDKVLEKYQSSLTTYSLTERFNFPPEVKTACEQYLLYFAEFLKDVGIKVSTNLTEEDKDVILTVIPENKEDALEKIGHLLNLYLHLPNGTLVSDYQLNAEMGIQAQKLYGQIKQLESQLSLTNTENQLLQLTVDSLNRDLKRYDSKILLESKTDKSKEKDKEPVIGNSDNAIVSLTEIDVWGVNVNLANLLRALKKAVRDS